MKNLFRFQHILSHGIILKSFIGLLVFGLLFSCSKEETTVEACFNISNIIPKTDESIKFTNCSKNYDKVEWDFGDGSSSTISDPSHSYDKSGIYKVTLKVYKGSDSKTLTKTVGVNKSLYLTHTLNLTNRKLVAPYNYAEYCNVYLFKSTDLKNPVNYSEFSNISPNWKNTFPVDLRVEDVYSNYKIKVEYFVTDKDGMNLPVDSFFTNEFNIDQGDRSSKAVNFSQINISLNFNGLLIN